MQTFYSHTKLNQLPFTWSNILLRKTFLPYLNLGLPSSEAIFTNAATYFTLTKFN